MLLRILSAAAKWSVYVRWHELVVECAITASCAGHRSFYHSLYMYIIAQSSHFIL